MLFNIGKKFFIGVIMSFTYGSDSDELNTKYYNDLFKNDMKMDTNTPEADPEPELATVLIYEVDNASDSIPNILANNTYQGLPTSALKKAKQAEQKKSDKVKEINDITQMFNKVSDILNQQFNLNINLDFNSIDSKNKSLENFIKPINKQASEYYLSEVSSTHLITLFSKFFATVELLFDRVTNPEYLMSESMTFQDNLVVLDKLPDIMKKIINIYKVVNVPDTILKLQKLSEKKKEVNYSYDTPEVRNALDVLTAFVREMNGKDLDRIENK